MATELNTDVNAELAPRKVRLPSLSRENCKLLETVNQSWRVVVPRGTPRSRMTESDFWATNSQYFQPYDRIMAVDEGRGFMAELLVIEAGRGYANVIELAYHVLPAIFVSQEGLPNNHEIVHAGPTDLYLVRRLSDGVILGKGFPSKQEALAFLLDHASLR